MCPPIDALVGEPIQHVQQREAAAALLCERQRFGQRRVALREIDRRDDVAERCVDVCACRGTCGIAIVVADTALATAVANDPGSQ